MRLLTILRSTDLLGHHSKFYSVPLPKTYSTHVQESKLIVQLSGTLKGTLTESELGAPNCQI